MLRLILVFFFILCGYQCILESNVTLIDETHLQIEAHLEKIQHSIKQIQLKLENQCLSNELLAKKLELETITHAAPASPKRIPISSSLSTEKSRNFSSCDEAMKNSNDDEGVFRISLPDSGLEPFFVYCVRNSRNDEAWMIIQRRMNGNINFYHGWQNYKYGFGDIFGDYWLGLERIHAITISRPHKLWIELKDFEGEVRNANYSLFAIENESAKYALNVLGSYTGTAGDSLRYHAGQKFQTYDSRNDETDRNDCALNRRGAWWFNNCQESDLNGEYYDEKANEDVDIGIGINWYSWQGNKYSLKYAHMAIRNIDSEN